LNNLMSF